MDDILMKGIGYWLLAIIESIITFFAYMLGHWINGIPAEMALMLASILGSTQVLLILIVKHFFKIVEEKVSYS